MDKVDSGNAIININRMIDFTLLDARATNADIEKLCDVAYKNEYYAVCVNPCNVAYAKSYIQKNFDDAIKVVSVIDFPLGASPSEVKCYAVSDAIKNGADEIDVVINIGRAKQGDFDYVRRELAKVVKAARKHIVKAILETCYFTENEIIKLCRACVKAKVDYVKTSTGFGTGGAIEKKVSLMVREVQGKCKVKASGGIRTREQAIRFAEIGASRIGTSHIL